jgi:hypothetical protein
MGQGWETIPLNGVNMGFLCILWVEFGRTEVDTPQIGMISCFVLRNGLWITMCVEKPPSPLRDGEAAGKMGDVRISRDRPDARRGDGRLRVGHQCLGGDACWFVSTGAGGLSVTIGGLPVMRGGGMAGSGLGLAPGATPSSASGSLG